jgi:hypothetical protein
MPVLCAMAFSDRCEEHCVPGGCGRAHGRACLKNMSECGEPLCSLPGQSCLGADFCEECDGGECLVLFFVIETIHYDAGQMHFHDQDSDRQEDGT